MSSEKPLSITYQPTSAGPTFDNRRSSCCECWCQRGVAVARPQDCGVFDTPTEWIKAFTAFVSVNCMFSMAAKNIIGKSAAKWEHSRTGRNKKSQIGKGILPITSSEQNMWTISESSWSTAFSSELERQPTISQPPANHQPTISQPSNLWRQNK